MTAVPIILTGQLNPASDTGISDNDGITSDNRPDFFGTSKPFSMVSLYARPTGGGSLIALGDAEANAVGAWNIQASLIPDGSFTITVDAVDLYGFETATTQIMPSAQDGPLLVDTVAPAIKDVSLISSEGLVLITFQADASGISLATIDNRNDYSVTGAIRRPGKYRVTGISTESDGGAIGPITVSLTINGGKPLGGNRARMGRIERRDHGRGRCGGEFSRPSVLRGVSFGQRATRRRPGEAIPKDASSRQFAAKPIRGLGAGSPSRKRYPASALRPR